jgi:endonuclease/exonuclease/phosphatase family metal-dependent hydrolase
MQLKIGTFNLNNLFSRYNFNLQADVPEVKEGTISIAEIKTVVAEAEQKQIEYKGIGLHRKDPAERTMLADRIKAMDLDVLCVQEIEDIETLRYFASTELASLYPNLILIEGNDPRLIDVAVMSKLPIGPCTTWQTAASPQAPGERVFSRDLLQATILNSAGTPLLTLFVNHLKSKFVPYYENQVTGKKLADERRKLQAETIAQILPQIMKPSDPFIVLGDMNDDISSPLLAPFAKSNALKLTNGLAHATETNPAPDSASPAKNQLWTHRYKPSGQPAVYELFDQIWLSPGLASKQTGAFIGRRQHSITGDGSDHDPAWVELSV